MPNVNPVTEMVDLISATRSYEANVTALNAMKHPVLPRAWTCCADGRPSVPSAARVADARLPRCRSPGLGAVGRRRRAPTAPRRDRSFANLIADKLRSAIELRRARPSAAEAVAHRRSDGHLGRPRSPSRRRPSRVEPVAAFRNKAIEAYQDVMRMQV